jgi:hypothetical protein
MIELWIGNILRSQSDSDSVRKVWCQDVTPYLRVALCLSALPCLFCMIEFCFNLNA